LILFHGSLGFFWKSYTYQGELWY